MTQITLPASQVLYHNRDKYDGVLVHANWMTENIETDPKITDFMLSVIVGLKMHGSLLVYIDDAIVTDWIHIAKLTGGVELVNWIIHVCPNGSVIDQPEGRFSVSKIHVLWYVKGSFTGRDRDLDRVEYDVVNGREGFATIFNKVFPNIETDQILIASDGLRIAMAELFKLQRREQE